MSARRVDVDLVQEISLSKLFSKNSLCGGTSADVAHADKQDFKISFIHVDFV